MEEVKPLCRPQIFLGLVLHYRSSCMVCRRWAFFLPSVAPFSWFGPRVHYILPIHFFVQGYHRFISSRNQNNPAQL